MTDDEPDLVLVEVIAGESSKSSNIRPETGKRKAHFTESDLEVIQIGERSSKTKTTNQVQNITSRRAEKSAIRPIDLESFNNPFESSQPKAPRRVFPTMSSMMGENRSVKSAASGRLLQGGKSKVPKDGETAATNVVIEEVVSAPIQTARNMQSSKSSLVNRNMAGPGASRIQMSIRNPTVTTATQSRIQQRTQLGATRQRTSNAAARTNNTTMNLTSQRPTHTTTASANRAQSRIARSAYIARNTGTNQISTSNGSLVVQQNPQNTGATRRSNGSRQSNASAESISSNNQRSGRSTPRLPRAVEDVDLALARSLQEQEFSAYQSDSYFTIQQQILGLLDQEISHGHNLSNSRFNDTSLYMRDEDFDDSYDALWALSERIGSVKQCTGVSETQFANFESKFYPKKEVKNQERQWN